MSAIYLTQYARPGRARAQAGSRDPPGCRRGLRLLRRAHRRAVVRDARNQSASPTPRAKARLRRAGHGRLIIPFVSSMADDSIAAVHRRCATAARDGGDHQRAIARCWYPRVAGIVAGSCWRSPRDRRDDIVVMAAGAAANLTPTRSKRDHGHVPDRRHADRRRQLRHRRRSRRCARVTCCSWLRWRSTHALRVVKRFPRSL